MRGRRDESTVLAEVRGPDQLDASQIGTSQDARVLLWCYHQELDYDWLFNGVVYVLHAGNRSMYRPKLPVPGE